MQFSFEAKNLELSQDPDALGTSHCNGAHCSTVYTIQQCTLFSSVHYFFCMFKIFVLVLRVCVRERDSFNIKEHQ